MKLPIGYAGLANHDTCSVYFLAARDSRTRPSSMPAAIHASDSTAELDKVHTLCLPESSCPDRQLLSMHIHTMRSGEMTNAHARTGITEPSPRGRLLVAEDESIGQKARGQLIFHVSGTSAANPSLPLHKVQGLHGVLGGTTRKYPPTCLLRIACRGMTGITALCRNVFQASRQEGW